MHLAKLAPAARGKRSDFTRCSRDVGAQGPTQFSAARIANSLKAGAFVAVRPHDVSRNQPPLGEIDCYSVLVFKQIQYFAG